jgi:hypothetical protein
LAVPGGGTFALTGEAALAVPGGATFANTGEAAFAMTGHQVLRHRPARVRRHSQYQAVEIGGIS